MKKKYLFILFIINIVFQPIKLIGQQPLRFEHYNQSSGISQGTGYSIAQYNNYLWFGTQDGLNRYDGYNFKIYRATKNNNLNNSYVPALLRDSKGRLWIGTGNGINFIDERKGIFSKFNQVFGLEVASELNTLSTKKLLEDKKGNIWIITDGEGIRRFNLTDKSVKSYLSSINTLTDCVVDNQGILWLSSTTQLFRFDYEKDEFQKIAIELPFKTDYFPIYSLLADDDKQLWLGTYSEGICVFSIINNKLIFKKQYKLGKGLLSNDISCMLKTVDKTIWIGTRTGGLSVFDKNKQLFIHNINSRNNPKSIADNHIWSLFEDQQHILWIGLSNRGIDKYDPKKFRFNIIQKDFDDTLNTLPDNMVFSILGYDDNIYIGTSSRISSLDINTKKTSPLFLDAKPSQNNYFNEVRTMSFDGQKNLWMMNWQGICKYKVVNKKIIKYPMEVNPSIYLFASLFFKNQVWIGGQNGLSVFDVGIGAEKWKNITHHLFSKEFARKQVRSLLADENEKIWIGTLGFGLYCFNTKSKQIHHFDGDIICSNIRSFLNDNQTLWVGTDCGLYKINKSTMRVEAQYDKFPNNVIYGILKDEKENLWISSNAGLSMFSAKSGLIIANYDENDGLQSNEFNTSCAYKTNDETMYFGGVNGISYFKAKEIKQNSFVPPVRITKIKVLDSLYNENLSEINLKNYQNFIELEFVAFNYSNSLKNTYKYMLQGIDRSWVDSGVKNTANYTNLPPGEYFFKVKGSNNDGIQNLKESTLKITIIPTFYQTWWFKMLLVIAFCSIFFIVYRNINVNKNLKISLAEEEFKRLRKETEMKEKETILQQKIAETEITALRSQMNPHFIFNCLNSIKLYSLENDSQSASDYLTKFSRLIRLVLENSRSEKVTLENELETLKLYIEMEAMRFKDKVKYQINIASNIDQQFIEIPPLLIQPFVENSIWHGLMHKSEGGTVKIDISQPKEQVLHIEISDDGIGREKALEYKSKSAMKQKSFGMKVTSERIELINQIYKTNTEVEIIDLKDQNGEAIGTKVILNIPI